MKVTTIYKQEDGDLIIMILMHYWKFMILLMDILIAKSLDGLDLMQINTMNY